MNPRSAQYQKERGERQMLRILDVVTKSPSTARQLAGRLSISGSAILIYTKRMRTAHRLHISDHIHSGGGRPAPIYAAGDLPDVEFVPRRKPKVRDRKTVQRERVIKAFHEPATAEQVASSMNLTASRARFYIKELRDQKKLYIKEWRSPLGRGDLTPVYALGNRPDKPKKRQTRAERYQLELADPDKHSRILAKRRARDWASRAARTPQTPWSALFAGSRATQQGSQS
jgi:predicted ArsR family transcriptional regulator